MKKVYFMLSAFMLLANFEVSAEDLDGTFENLENSNENLNRVKDAKKTPGFEELSETVRELLGRVEVLEKEVQDLKTEKAQEENAQKEADNVVGKAPETVVKEVEDLIEQNEMEKARRIIHTFVDKNPTSIYCGMLLFYAGSSYFIEKDYQNAAMEYMKSFRANPKGAKSAEGLFKLALCFRNLSQMEKCKSTLEKIIKEYSGEFANKAKSELKKLKEASNNNNSDNNIGAENI